MTSHEVTRGHPRSKYEKSKNVQNQSCDLSFERKLHAKRIGNSFITSTGSPEVTWGHPRSKYEKSKNVQNLRALFQQFLRSLSSKMIKTSTAGSLGSKEHPQCKFSHNSHSGLCYGLWGQKKRPEGLKSTKTYENGVIQAVFDKESNKPIFKTTRWSPKVTRGQKLKIFKIGQMAYQIEANCTGNRMQVFLAPPEVTQGHQGSPKVKNENFQDRSNGLPN